MNDDNKHRSLDVQEEIRLFEEDLVCIRIKILVILSERIHSLYNDGSLIFFLTQAFRTFTIYNLIENRSPLMGI